MKIALLQILPTGSLNGNREKGVEACRKAKVLGADIALFPEMWSNGYDIPEDAEALQRAAKAAIWTPTLEALPIMCSMRANSSPAKFQAR